MKLDENSSVRLFHKGNAYWQTGCNMGFMIAAVPEYAGWADEQMSWKTDCYIGDWTPCLDDLYLSGPDALAFLKSIITNSFENFAVGKAKHYVMCNAAGKVAAEGILMKLEEEKYVMQSNTNYALFQYYSNIDKYPNMTVRQPEFHYFENYKVGTTTDCFKFQVSGPKALALCEKVTGRDLKDVKYMNFVPVNIAGVDCIALRQGMAGEIGFEFQGPVTESARLYQYIFEAGEEFGCRRLGAKTAMINHLEACFPTFCFHYAAPIDEAYDEYQRQAGFEPYYTAVTGSFDGEYDELSHSPYEMGWASCVKFDHDFVGREALEEEAAAPRRKVVTLEFNSEDIISLYASYFQSGQEPYEFFDMPMMSYCHVQADKIFDKSGNEIGIATTPGYSVYFRKMLSLSFVDTEAAKPGTEVEVLWGSPGKPQKRIRAVVCPAPYKTDNRMSDLHQVSSKN